MTAFSGQIKKKKISQYSSVRWWNLMKVAQECFRSSWKIHGKVVTSAWHKRLLLLLSAELSYHAHYLSSKCFTCIDFFFFKLNTAWIVALLHVNNVNWNVILILGHGLHNVIRSLPLKRGSNYNVKTVVRTCLNLINDTDFKKKKIWFQSALRSHIWASPTNTILMSPTPPFSPALSSAVGSPAPSLVPILVLLWSCRTAP